MNDFSAVIEAHCDAVWRTAFRLLNHHDDALDCYQETFLAALQLSKKGEVRHWRTMLVRIATRRAIDRLRQRYQSEKAFDVAQRLQRGGSPSPAPEARAEAEELREQVRRALGALPADPAEAFWLRHVEQLEVGEIAELMGIEAGHVRVLSHRAALALRGLLGPSLGPESTAEKLP